MKTSTSNCLWEKIFLKDAYGSSSKITAVTGNYIKKPELILILGVLMPFSDRLFI